MSESELVRKIKGNATEKICNKAGTCLYAYNGKAYKINKSNKILDSYAYFTNEDVHKSIRLVDEDQKRRK